MEILGIEKVSMVDYKDKICATIFTGGCNFRCPFCHNSGIVEKKYNYYSEDEILEYLKDRKKLLDAVVISGGEPTLQKDLARFIEEIKKLGFAVKLDTNGTNPDVLKELLEKKLLDYVAVDIKNDFASYSGITGISNPNVEGIKKSLKLLKEFGVDYELRTTLVKEFHSKENIERLSEDLKGEKLLYLQKFKLSEGVFNQSLHEVEKKEAEIYQKILSKEIKNVLLRGY